MPRGQGSLHSCPCAHHPSPPAALHSAPTRHGAGPVPHPSLVPAMVTSLGHCIWKKKLINNSNHKNKHGEQAGNICSETCCLQEGGRNPSPKPAGYICGALGVTTNQGLQKHSHQKLLHRQEDLTLIAAGFARNCHKNIIAMAESSIYNRNSQGLNRAGEDLLRRNSVYLTGVKRGMGSPVGSLGTGTWCQTSLVLGMDSGNNLGRQPPWN